MAGQHLRVRVLSLSGRSFESHPLTILSTPQDGKGVLLGTRAAGDWSRQLFQYASAGEHLDTNIRKEPKLTLQEGAIDRRHAYVLLEGPYGGCSIDVRKDILLVAGGSGVTFALSVISDAINNTLRTSSLPTSTTPTVRRVRLVWCIKGFGHIRWFAPQLQGLAALAQDPAYGVQFEIRIFVTCLCDPEAISPIAGCVVEEVVGARPKGGVAALLKDFMEDGRSRDGNSIAICATGPESLTREAKNAAARLGGGVEVHTELFSM